METLSPCRVAGTVWTLKPSLEGWKLSFLLRFRDSSLPLKPSLEGWKLLNLGHKNHVQVALKPSLEGWKHSGTAPWGADVAVP